MIQSNEFRNGNFILFYGMIYKLNNVGEYGVSGTYRNNKFNAKYTHPSLESIPLTEEILLKKCRFENYTGDFLELTITEDLSIIWVGYLGIMIGGSTVFFPEKDKVHELQNLYKELKGEELDINL